MVSVVIFFLIAALISSGSSSVSRFLTSFLLTPFQRITTDAAKKTADALMPSKTYEELSEENKQLSEENRRLNRLLADYYEIRRENEELERFYSIKRENRDYSVLPSRVIGRDSNENFCGFTLDRGSMDGVEINDPVMTENGLVGWVSEVSSKSCIVSTILSPDASVGVIVSRTGEGGVITGDAVSADENLTNLRNLSPHHTVRIQDLIVTSGAGGIFPKNIPVGQVKEILLDEYSGMPTAVIGLFEDIRTVESAVIVTDFSTKGTIAKEDASSSENK